MTAIPFNQGEVQVLRGAAYLRRFSYFAIATCLVIVDTVLAVQH
jgi:hypothetical protein